MSRSIALQVMCVLFTAALARPAQSAEEPKELWFYYPVNLLPAENIDKLEKLWTRAAAAGYTKVLLTDSKFTRLDSMPKAYFQHCQRVKQLAHDLKIEIVPAEFGVGYSNDLLASDPNLAEGLPVRDTLFVVQNGQAHVVADPPVALNKLAYKDDTVQVEGNVATVHDNAGNARLVYKLTLPKYRCYHVSVQIKTQGYTGRPEIHPIAGERTLNWQSVPIEETQDWKHYDIVFDTLDNTDVNLFFGVWGDAKGTLQWKDWTIEEVGLVNVLRRPGAPCTVTGPDGKHYVEGTDYERIVDPKMGVIPWSGEYTSWHEPPELKTRLPDGTRLRVSWYYPPIVYDEQVAACIAEPRTMQVLAEESRKVKELWGAKGYLMSHDEFRCFGWDESCERRHLTPGEMLAENARQCTQLIEPQQPYAWNDMFDPYHNAVKGPYYLVNGPWTGSWNGLDKRVIVMNWNFGHRDESLKFFADRGHRQILAGYYDGPMSDWKKWLESGSRVQGVVGYMYTTWRADYSHLEEFAQMGRAQ